MRYPRFKRYSIIALTVLAAVIVLARCLPTPTQADPTIGPPTIETHLANINAALALNTKIILGALGVIGTLLGYLFKSTVNSLKTENGHASRKADVALEKIDNIEREFMSIATHDRICREVNK